MPLGIEVDPGPCHIALDGDPALPPPERAQHPSSFRPMSIVVKRSPISATAITNFKVARYSGMLSPRRLIGLEAKLFGPAAS